jgi:two-component system sensor histidine kinase SenX3
MIQAADEPKQVKKFASRLVEEAARLKRITSELIDLSRLQSESVRHSGKKVSLDNVIAQSVDSVKVAAESKNIDIVVAGQKDLLVYGSQKTLTMAMSNLLTNAVRYSHENSRVGIGVVAKESSIEISVTDYGIGMTPEEAERVFERFYRTDEARSRDTGGSGIGLSIVKYAVQNHGGRVRVWSMPGQGATFTITLPNTANKKSDTKKKPSRRKKK